MQEIGAAHDVPEDWVFELFQQAAFPGQAIGRTVLGTPESIRAHTSDDLKRFLGDALLRAADRASRRPAMSTTANWCGSPSSISAGCPAIKPARARAGQLQGRAAARKCAA